MIPKKACSSYGEQDSSLLICTYIVGDQRIWAIVQTSALMKFGKHVSSQSPSCSEYKRMTDFESVFHVTYAQAMSENIFVK
jgi:hypothetical protein